LAGGNTVARTVSGMAIDKIVDGVRPRARTNMRGAFDAGTRGFAGLPFVVGAVAFLASTTRTIGVS
jgi:hypothetical protein